MTPVMRGLCTPHELKTVYTLTDVLDMHEAIAETARAEKRAQRDTR